MGVASWLDTIQCLALVPVFGNNPPMNRVPVQSGCGTKLQAGGYEGPVQRFNDGMRKLKKGISDEINRASSPFVRGNNAQGSRIQRMWKQRVMKNRRTPLQNAGVFLFSLSHHILQLAIDRFRLREQPFPGSVHTHGYLISTLNITATTCALSSPSERRLFMGLYNMRKLKPGARPYIPVRGSFHDMIGQLTLFTSTSRTFEKRSMDGASGDEAGMKHPIYMPNCQTENMISNTVTLSCPSCNSLFSSDKDKGCSNGAKQGTLGAWASRPWTNVRPETRP
ncbi:hypothetical protein B0T13DRAFT_190752 [Neurospora crassa]|nr:hypothetical protein B0T13DRAFT_190752 [Neurospora crassa]